MATYTVQAGDNLFRIAEKHLGSAGDWRLIAELNGLRDRTIRVGQELVLPGEKLEVANIVNSAEGTFPQVVDQVRILEQDGRYFVEDDQGVRFDVGKKYKQGIYRVGRVRPERFMRNASALLGELNLTPSEIKVMTATAENEGNLDGVNSWDGHFLSFGIFQWTAGGAHHPGELAALLARVQARFPDDFEHYWGRFGIGLEEVGKVTGWISLKGQRLVSRQQKDVLRAPIWAYRFAQAGADEEVNAAQIAQALGRIEQFYFTPSPRLGQRPLAQLITSEFGVALLLDHHVNRPGYLIPSVAEALQLVGMSASELASGSADDERQLLEKYLEVRRRYGAKPMTAAAERAEVTRSYLERGVISDERGSFRTHRGDSNG